MQDQLDVVKEVISILLNNSREGKKQLKEWFLNNLMEEARVQLELFHESLSFFTSGSERL